MLLLVVDTNQCDVFVFFFKQKTAYEMRISDWSSDVCSSDLGAGARWRRAGVPCLHARQRARAAAGRPVRACGGPAAAVHPSAVASGRPGAPVRLFQSAGSGSAARLAPQHHSLSCLAAMSDRPLPAVTLIRSLATAKDDHVL